MTKELKETLQDTLKFMRLSKKESEKITGGEGNSGGFEDVGGLSCQSCILGFCIKCVGLCTLVCTICSSGSAS